MQEDLQKKNQYRFCRTWKGFFIEVNQNILKVSNKEHFCLTLGEREISSEKDEKGTTSDPLGVLPRFLQICKNE